MKTVVSFDEDQTVIIDALRKKVTIKLIDISSPNTPQKQQVFDSLVQKKDNTRVILEMALEMGSSVEDTKTMLMNNCI